MGKLFQPKKKTHQTATAALIHNHQQHEKNSSEMHAKTILPMMEIEAHHMQPEIQKYCERKLKETKMMTYISKK